MKQARILVVGGSSGGHLFPALAFLDTLKEKYPDLQLLLVLPRIGLKPQEESSRYTVNFISLLPLRLRLDFKSIIAILNFFKGSVESIFLLFTFRPQLVAGFGGVTGIPLLFFARLFGISTLIHEQNVLPGQANRLAALFCDKIAISFAETQRYLKGCRKKIVITGNPLRKALVRHDKDKALAFFGFSADKFTPPLHLEAGWTPPLHARAGLTLLVMGGSQGSHRINLALLNILSTTSFCGLQVIHICGDRDYDMLKNAYQGLDLKVRVFSFLEEIAFAYSAADLVLCRGGATTIAELLYFQLPAIIVPYPFAYRHQLSNARILETLGTGYIILDQQLEGEILKNTLTEMINNTDKIELLRSGYAHFIPHPANELLVSEAMSLLS